MPVAARRTISRTCPVCLFTSFKGISFLSIINNTCTNTFYWIACYPAGYFTDDPATCTVVVVLFYIWGVSRKLATSVNQGDTILTMMDVIKCTQITNYYWTTDRRPNLNTFFHLIITGLRKSVNPVVMFGTYPNIYTTSIGKWIINANKMHTHEQIQCNIHNYILLHWYN